MELQPSVLTDDIKYTEYLGDEEVFTIGTWIWDQMNYH